MSRRSEQVGAQIERALQEVLARGLQDPRIKGLVTVTGVRVTDDLQEAEVRVSVLPAEHAPLTMHGLTHAGRHIRRLVGDRVELRRVPRLRFTLDESLKRQAGVLEALSRVARERGTDRIEDAGGHSHGDRPE